MDVTDVRSLATTFGGVSERLRQAGTSVTDGVSRSWWHGPDADSFRTSWAQQRLTLDNVATVLSEIRETLLREAEQQEIASQIFGTPTCGTLDGTGAFGHLEPGFGHIGPTAGHVGALYGDVTADLFGKWDEARERIDRAAEKAREGAEDFGRTAKELGGKAVDWLKWLASPEGPSTEDATAKVPGLQWLMGVGMDLAMKHGLVAAVVGEFAGFEYVPAKDFYTTNETSVQSHLGFHDAFDKVGKLGGMDLDDKVVEFESNGKQYRLELWKGGYGSGAGFGGEIGLYTRSADETGLRGLFEKIPGYYSSAQGHDQIAMTQSIYNKQTGEVYFTNEGKGAADGDHYWNLAIRTKPGIRREDIGQMGTLHVPDAQTRTAMAGAMRQQGLTPVVNDADGTISYTWEG